MKRENHILIFPCLFSHGQEIQFYNFTRIYIYSSSSGSQATCLLAISQHVLTEINFKSKRQDNDSFQQQKVREGHCGLSADSI